MVIKVDPWLLINNNVICVAYVHDCLFWLRLKYDIDKLIKSFKEDYPIYNWGH